MSERESERVSVCMCEREREPHARRAPPTIQRQREMRVRWVKLRKGLGVADLGPSPGIRFVSLQRAGNPRGSNWTPKSQVIGRYGRAYEPTGL